MDEVFRALVLWNGEIISERSLEVIITYDVTARPIPTYNIYFPHLKYRKQLDRDWICEVLKRNTRDALPCSTYSPPSLSPANSEPAHTSPTKNTPIPTVPAQPCQQELLALLDAVVTLTRRLLAVESPR